MTDKKKTFADRVRGHTEDSPHAHGRWTDVLKHRWPTALGIAVAALSAFDLEETAPRFRPSSSPWCSSTSAPRPWIGAGPRGW